MEDRIFLRREFMREHNVEVVGNVPKYADWLENHLIYLKYVLAIVIDNSSIKKFKGDKKKLLETAFLFDPEITRLQELLDHFAILGNLEEDKIVIDGINKKIEVRINELKKIFNYE